MLIGRDSIRREYFEDISTNIGGPKVAKDGDHVGIF